MNEELENTSISRKLKG